MKHESGLLFEQLIPISLTVLVFTALAAVVFFVVQGLNVFYPQNPIVLQLRFGDMAAGAVIYFKTAVDFVIFMGLLMKFNAGWQKRVAIEIGTALGNGLGTILILVLWVIFKQLHVLLAAMILLSALILFELAAEGLNHFKDWQRQGGPKKILFNVLDASLRAILKIIHPITSKIVPDFSKNLSGQRTLSFGKLLMFSLAVPLLLGLDNFAGYVPLFSIVNVFGFAVGTLLAHMLLNIALFINPLATAKWVGNQFVAFLGTAAFTVLAVWGIAEAVKILANG